MHHLQKETLIFFNLNLNLIIKKRTIYSTVVDRFSHEDFYLHLHFIYILFILWVFIKFLKKGLRAINNL